MIKTPKQEAEELVKMFRDYSWVSCEDGYEITSNIESAKQCAIIAVKRIIDEYQSISDLESTLIIKNKVVNVIEKLIYWQEVKQEIENYEP